MTDTSQPASRSVLAACPAFGCAMILQIVQSVWFEEIGFLTYGQQWFRCCCWLQGKQKERKREEEWSDVPCHSIYLI